MFGWRDSGLDQVLNRLAAELPETRWLLLMDEHGIEKASFPNFIDGTDRIAAMSVASSSLGERVVKELKGGGLR
jgi:predicted regulator of Ras-like GTPase activity (Roadblock/LC7/MglB family)